MTKSIAPATGALTEDTLGTITVLASAARTASTNNTAGLGDITNSGYRGVHVVIDATAGSGASVVFTIEGKDAVSGKYYTILASAAVAASGTTVLKVFPGATASANAAANDCIPAVWRVKAVAADATSLTYSVAAAPLP